MHGPEQTQLRTLSRGGWKMAMNFRKVILYMDENVVILIRSPVCHSRNEFSRVVSNLIISCSLRRMDRTYRLTWQDFVFSYIFFLLFGIRQSSILSTGLIGYLMAPPLAHRLLWPIMLHAMHTQSDGIHRLKGMLDSFWYDSRDYSASKRNILKNKQK